MCNRLPEINKNGDAGIFPVYYSLNIYFVQRSLAPSDPNFDTLLSQYNDNTEEESLGFFSEITQTTWYLWYNMV